MTPASAPTDLIGQRVRRIEDPRLLRGGGRFVDDEQPRRLLHAAFVRAPLASARIRDLDVDEARAHPAAVAVLTAADLSATCPSWRGVLDWPGMVAGEQAPLARDVVRHVGEPVVLVLAPSRALAEDVAELVWVDYDPRPAVVDPVAALEPGSPLVDQAIGTNSCFEATFGSGDVDEAFARAHVVISADLQTGRHTATAMEARGVLARYEPATRQLEVRVSTQAPHMLQALYAQLLGLPENAVRVLTEDVGGAFGMKAFVYPDEMAVVAASVLLGRSVKWVQDRYEALQSDTQARDERIAAKLAVAEDGTFLGLRAEVISDAGAYSPYPRTCVTEGVQVCTIMPGPYRIPAVSTHLRVVFTNKAPLAVYRAVGHPPAILAMETLVDRAAAALGINGVELRRRNLLTPDQLPYTSATGHTYDSGSHLEALELLAAQLDDGHLADLEAEVAASGELLGVGIACFVELSAPGAMFYGARGAPITAHDQVEVRVEPDGTVTALLGTPGQGQGLETTAAQVVAQVLGVPFSDVRVIAGDTRVVPHGSGVWGSRSAVVSGGAAWNAAEAVRERVLAVASHLLEVSPDDLDLVDGVVGVKGDPAASLPLSGVARAAHWGAHQLPDGTDLSLAYVAAYEGPDATFNNGAHAAIVAVDPRTGLVRLLDYVVVEDCGVLINPDVVDGQIRGGIAQGVGGALLERIVYDDDGQLLTASLLDYLIPTATDLPDIRIHHLQTPAPGSLLGTKGVGEAGTAGAPAAVHRAVDAALARLGAHVDQQPITPEVVLDAVHAAGPTATS